MTSMKDREEGFERKFALDEEQKFRAVARRNKLLGMWAAEKLGKSGADAEAYAETIVTDYLERMAEEHEPMPDWWDAHDRGLLVRFVTQECES